MSCSAVRVLYLTVQWLPCDTLLSFFCKLFWWDFTWKFMLSYCKCMIGVVVFAIMAQVTYFWSVHSIVESALCASQSSHLATSLEWHHTQVTRLFIGCLECHQVTRQVTGDVWYVVRMGPKTLFHANEIIFMTLLYCLMCNTAFGVWGYCINVPTIKWTQIRMDLALRSPSIQSSRWQLISSRWHWMKMVLSSCLVILASSSVSLFLAKKLWQYLAATAPPAASECAHIVLIMRMFASRFYFNLLIIFLDNFRLLIQTTRDPTL